MKQGAVLLLALLLLLLLLLPGCDGLNVQYQGSQTMSALVLSLDSIPAFQDGTPWVEINGNVPSFSEEEKKNTDGFETYAELDALGRCGTAYANVCRELMPTEERGSIGSVKPSGWQSVKYDNVDGKYLYNRCHLIGFQLTGENANKGNLITGTRYLNIEGMLPFENMVADYVKETGNHVLYRVAPIFTGDELVARGVLMEGWSVEDEGDGICYCIYAYNSQPGIAIDYATGESWAEGAEPGQTAEFVLNKSSKKFHLPDCENAGKISEKNRETVTGSREELISQGYSPCGACLG
ncbi:MAG: DNA/RNA non-specific endonuclease [Lawsonibacter sp.]|nr:DNA/RNA non-specific endonuclease [Lawsonibacter sp.]